MAALIGAVKSADPGAPKTSGFTVQIPLDLLSEDGVPPASGDAVSFSVDGSVESADDENATVKIEAVNGQPVDESSAQEASEDSECLQHPRLQVHPQRCAQGSRQGLKAAVSGCSTLLTICADHC